MSFINILEGSNSEEHLTEAVNMREIYLKELKTKYMNDKKGFVRYLAQDLKNAYLESLSDIQKKLNGIKLGVRLPSMSIFLDLENEYSEFIAGIEDLFTETKDMSPDVFYFWCEEEFSKGFDFRGSFGYWVKRFRV